MAEYTSRQKLEELWRRGVIAPLLLHSGQQQVYDKIAANKAQLFVLNVSRRWGKSYALCVLAIEEALRYENADIKMITMTQKATRKIIVPLMREILQTCPKVLRPKFHSHDGIWKFPNGSTIHVGGTEMQQVDNLRGQACDLALVDEAGFVSDLEYAIESVIRPQFLGRPRARLIMASTPPVAPDHPFVSRYIKDAMATGSYVHMTIYDNPRLSAADIAAAMHAAGGEGTTAWRREYLAELVTERESAVFPEATADVMDQMVGEVERPPFFLPFVAVDLGYLDYTGVVFGYYHFPRARLVIEDEILMNRANSAEIVSAIKAKEKALWGDLKVSRVVDASGILVADLNEVHGFTCRPAEKADLQGNVNRLRMDLAARTPLFHPRCTNIMSQLMFVSWEKNKRQFSRGAKGHNDLAAAMVYFAKHVDRNTNPIPPGYGRDPFREFGWPRKRPSDLAERVRSMFPPLFRPPEK